MIKYLGSKRTLVPVLGAIASTVGARTAVDLFTGTTRVAQEFKRRGLFVTAADVASYSAVLSDTFVATDARAIDRGELAEVVAELDALPGEPGYVTETFCGSSRYFQPHNGARIDAIRAAIEDRYRGTPLYPLLLTSLLLAADKVDSTAGVQMAYLKGWAPRAYRPMRLLPPALLDGPGRTVVGDATETVRALEPVDLMYLDPPYNQHRYFTNYHVWETLIRWDAPDWYGVACKRVDARAPETKSVFNSRRRMPEALDRVIRDARARLLVVSYNNESWISPQQMVASLTAAGHERVRMLSFDRRRYIGAVIGIHNAAGEKVGSVSHTRNVEHLFLAGPADLVEAASRVAQAWNPVDAASAAATGGAPG